MCVQSWFPPGTLSWCQTVWTQIVGPDLDQNCLQSLSADASSRCQERYHFVGPDLGPNSWQRLSADVKSRGQH